MVNTFGIKTIKEIADKLNMSEIVLIDKTLDYFDNGNQTLETRNSITVKDVMQFLKEEWFEYYISLCDDIYTLKKLADEDIYDKKIEYDPYNAPKNNYTRIDERIKELNLKNQNKDTHTPDTNQNTNITIYVPTAKQAREQSKSCRQPQINTIINIIKPVVEKEIIEAINKGLYKVDIARFFNDDVFNDDEARKIKSAICDINNTEYTYEDFTQAMDTIRWLLIDKGYDVKIYYNKYENGIEVSWKNDY